MICPNGLGRHLVVITLSKVENGGFDVEVVLDNALFHLFVVNDGGKGFLVGGPSGRGSRLRRAGGFVPVVPGEDHGYGRSELETVNHTWMSALRVSVVTYAGLFGSILVEFVVLIV